MQAKDIDDTTMLAAVYHLEKCTGLPAMLSELQAYFPPVIPPKVVLAKLRKLLKRKLITGCGCGCRGDFRVVPT